MCTAHGRKAHYVCGLYAQPGSEPATQVKGRPKSAGEEHLLAYYFLVRGLIHGKNCGTVMRLPLFGGGSWVDSGGKSTIVGGPI